MKKAAVSLALMPGVVKYSALAMKVTRRLISAGKKKESENERWLLAMIAAPSVGMFSSPSIHGRKKIRSSGATIIFISR